MEQLTTLTSLFNPLLKHKLTGSAQERVLACVAIGIYEEKKNKENFVLGLGSIKRTGLCGSEISGFDVLALATQLRLVSGGVCC